MLGTVVKTVGKEVAKVVVVALAEKAVVEVNKQINKAKDQNK